MAENKRLLTQKEFEIAEKAAAWANDYNPILEAQDDKTRRETLKEVGKYLRCVLNEKDEETRLLKLYTLPNKLIQGEMPEVK